MAAKVWILACAICVAFWQTTAAENVLGCGGFVKSDVDINFSRVEVKLYTPHGSIKYQTDCAPNTGYYLIPLYDKGDFTLKVEPPQGWSFEPTSVDVHVDGSTDKCSLGEDVNFKFTGFSIVGQVVSKGQKSGPEGVTLTLSAAGSKDVLQTVISGEGGSYTFARVMPGDYVVRASHPQWTIDSAEVKVKVTNDNGNAGSSITVSGYPVSGQVLSDGEPIKGVNFILYSTTVPAQSVTGCEKSAPKGFTNREASPPLCHVTSREDGSFSWPSLPSASYTLVSFYKGENIVFDVKPERLEFAVAHDSVKLSEVFQVAGFSVSGRVLDSKGGGGVAGAKVLIDGKEAATTAADGLYHLDNMKTGSYRIAVTAPKMAFDEVTVKVTPNTPLLPDLIASQFGLCGKVTIDRVPEGLSVTSQRRVIHYPAGKASEAVSLTTESDGSFCTMVRPGSYVVKVHLSDAELRAGLQLSPTEKQVTVTNKPVLNILFSQFRAKVSGTVSCMEKCGQIEISLDPVGRADGKQVVRVKETPKIGTFMFEDVMPGKYKVNMLQDVWCWKEKTLEIEVVDTDLTNLEFIHSGYILKCSISHYINLNFAHEKKAGSVGSFTLSKGTNRFCLAQPGIYRLTPDSCHQFEKPVYTYDTSNPVMLTLTAVRHEVKGSVTTTEPVSDIFVTIKSSVEPAPVELGPLKQDGGEGRKAEGKLRYHFSHLARSGEKLEVSVKSKEVLFSPPKMELVVPEDRCSEDDLRFEGRRGVFITGSVSPPLEGVQVTVEVRGGSEALEPITLVTQASGKFRLGPLDPDLQYEVKAEKLGYSLSRQPSSSSSSSSSSSDPVLFRAFQLGQVQVKVEDREGRPLGSVLLSLSGEKQYRNNLLTGENGTITFSQLSPGQYFLRPMMKEYQFEPASQTLQVAEGTTKQLTITGTRVAFSCYGRVSSLNGEAEAGVTVEGAGGPACPHSQEEAKTDQEGNFRLRGLQPQCSYTIRLRTGEVNAHIERTVPKNRTVQVKNEDVHGVHIIAFRRMNQMDLSGNMKTDHTNLPSLKVRLFREDNPDSPIHTIQLSKSAFFYLPSLPIDNKKYTLRLECSLSKTLYSYTLPEAAFTANQSYRHFTLSFQPRPRAVEQELQQGPVLVLPLLLLLAGLAYNYRKVMPVLSQGLGQVQGWMQRGPASASASDTFPASDASAGDAPTASSLKRRNKSRRT